MIRSLNEVQRICQKAAEGAGAPAGLDSDAAQSAVWLLARDLPALADLAEDLTRFADLAAACRFERGGFGDVEVLDLSDKACTVIAPMLVDLLVARATLDSEPGRLRAAGLSSPLFLLPPAVEYGKEGWQVRLSLAAGPDECFEIRIAAGGEIELLGTGEKFDALLEAGSDWSLDAVCASDQLDRPSQADLPVIVDGDRLAAAGAHGLAEGVSPDPESWGRLQALAAKVLVPATEQSHRLGAGALASDNE